MRERRTSPLPPRERPAAQRLGEGARPSAPRAPQSPPLPAQQAAEGSAPSPRARGPVLIVARAARQLAAAAAAAGYRPFVVDLFGDEDTRQCAERLRVTPAGPGFGFRPQRLLADLAAIAPAGQDMPLVWGAGFEARPELLLALAARHAVLGSAPAGLAELAAPRSFATRLASLGLPHPALAFAHVPARGRWLVKRRGEAGGWHVRAGAPREDLADVEYAQAFVPGRSLSVAFVADARRVVVLGYSEHLGWSGTAASFGYAGAVGGISLPAAMRRDVTAALPRLARAFGLRGLCGCDFIVAPDGSWHLLEINARPTATFDLLVTPASAFRAHVAACSGGTWARPRPRSRVHAHAICHAPDPIQIPNSLDWPAWVADRPCGGARLPRGAPLCTVRADGISPADALAALTRRVQRLRRLLGIEDPTVPVFRRPA